MNSAWVPLNLSRRKRPRLRGPSTISATRSRKTPISGLSHWHFQRRTITGKERMCMQPSTNSCRIKRRSSIIYRYPSRRLICSRSNRPWCHRPRRQRWVMHGNCTTISCVWSSRRSSWIGRTYRTFLDLFPTSTQIHHSDHQVFIRPRVQFDHAVDPKAISNTMLTLVEMLVHVTTILVRSMPWWRRIQCHWCHWTHRAALLNSAIKPSPWERKNRRSRNVKKLQGSKRRSMLLWITSLLTPVAPSYHLSGRQ